jgi:rRNA maturation protein Nop10
MKMPLCLVHSVYTNSETAVACGWSALAAGPKRFQ